jgi:hypothetical protein
MPANKRKRGGSGGRAAPTGKALTGKFRPQGGLGAHDASAAPQEQSLRRARVLQALLARKSRDGGGPSSAETLRLRLQLGVALRNGGEIERAATELLAVVALDVDDTLHAHRLAAPLLLFLGRTEEVRWHVSCASRNGMSFTEVGKGDEGRSSV